MKKKVMTSLERTMTAIGHREPDRVPLFLLLSLYGAKELQIPVKEYFSKVEDVVSAQIKMREKYKNDCIYTFFYASIEIEAFGGEVIFVDDGPPNSGEPLMKSVIDIEKFTMPIIKESKSLLKVLDVTQAIKAKIGNETPIIGVVMSPFSLPVLQMGFEKYLELIYSDKKSFNLLMQKNEEFCVQWANAQLAAGATAICYFDPLSSPKMIERSTYISTGQQIAKRTISRIKGPVATHLASGITLPVLDDIVDTGAAVLGFSSDDDLEAVKGASKNKICLLGNLNAIDMINWNSSRVEQEVKNIIKKAGQSGGLILADNHGEIPWQVPEHVLLEISEATQRFGRYPLEWVETNE